MKKAYLIVPTLSLVIFFLQLYLVKNQNLSPWKGGGFGMFAHIDAPDMRVIMVNGITTENDTIKIKVPFSGGGEYGPYTHKMGLKLRTLPNMSKLEKLANMLIEDDYISSNKKKIDLNQHLKSSGISSNTVVQHEYYRPLYSYEQKDKKALNTKQLKAIKLQLLRIVYNRKSHSLSYQNILDPIILTNDR